MLATTTHTLFHSACVLMAMAPDRHVTIRALDATLTDDTVDAMLARTEALLREAAPFRTTWDLRRCRAPSSGQVWRCLRWALRNRATLDAHNTRLAIVYDAQRASAPLLLSSVRLVLRAFGPSCPTYLGPDEAAARGFMEE